MSGGYFEYQQYRIEDIAREIDRLIQTNGHADQYGDARSYSYATIERFQYAAWLLRTAAIYAQRIDWLVSGDDSEDTFHERLTRDLLEAE